MIIIIIKNRSYEGVVNSTKKKQMPVRYVRSIYEEWEVWHMGREWECERERKSTLKVGGGGGTSVDEVMLS